MVVYRCDDRKLTEEQRAVDIPVGILRALKGVLAGNRLCWMTRRISYGESRMRYGIEYCKALVGSLETW